VKEIEKSTLSEVRADRANIQLLNAQIKVALLPSSTSPDLNVIDKFIDQKAELRASIQKAFVASRTKLVQIMGQDTFDSYIHLHNEFFARNRTFARRSSFEGKSANGNIPGFGFGGGLLQ
jgi:hypothetical protein